MDSASYLIGVNQGNQLKQEGVTNLNTTLISTGCNEASENKPRLLSQEVVNNVMMTFLEQAKKEKAKSDSGKAVIKQVVKTTPSKSLLKNLNDSASYIVGYSITTFYKNYDIPQLNAQLVARAFSDILKNKPLLLSADITNEVLNKLIHQIHEEKAKATIDEGNTFLAKNKLRPEVKTTPSGLQYEIITEGTGLNQPLLILLYPITGVH